MKTRTPNRPRYALVKLICLPGIPTALRFSFSANAFTVISDQRMANPGGGGPAVVLGTSPAPEADEAG